MTVGDGMGYRGHSDIETPTQLGERWHHREMWGTEKERGNTQPPSRITTITASIPRQNKTQNHNTSKSEFLTLIFLPNSGLYFIYFVFLQPVRNISSWHGIMK